MFLTTTPTLQLKADLELLTLLSAWVIFHRRGYLTLALSLSRQCTFWCDFYSFQAFLKLILVCICIPESFLRYFFPIDSLIDLRQGLS